MIGIDYRYEKCTSRYIQIKSGFPILNINLHKQLVWGGPSIGLYLSTVSILGRVLSTDRSHLYIHIFNRTGTGLRRLCPKPGQVSIIFLRESN